MLPLWGKGHKCVLPMKLFTGAIYKKASSHWASKVLPARKAAWNSAHFLGSSHPAQSCSAEKLQWELSCKDGELQGHVGGRGPLACFWSVGLSYLPIFLLISHPRSGSKFTAGPFPMSVCEHEYKWQGGAVRWEVKKNFLTPAVVWYCITWRAHHWGTAAVQIMQ